MYKLWSLIAYKLRGSQRTTVLSCQPDWCFQSKLRFFFRSLSAISFAFHSRCIGSLDRTYLYCGGSLNSEGSTLAEDPIGHLAVQNEIHNCSSLVSRMKCAMGFHPWDPSEALYSAQILLANALQIRMQIFCT